MEFVGSGVDVWHGEMVAFEEEDGGGDVALSEDFRRRFRVEGFEVVDAEDWVPLWVGGERVRWVQALLLPLVLGSQLSNLEGRVEKIKDCLMRVCLRTKCTATPVNSE